MAARIGTKHSDETRAKISATAKGKLRGQYDDTEFEQKWGIHAKQLAQEEGVTTAAIHMRTMRFGTPFQRRMHPTRCEKISGRTVGQWARALDMHPVSIDLRIHRHNDPTFVHSNGYGANTIHSRRAKIHWTDARLKKTFGERCWLHPRHHNYENWMAQFKRFDKYFAGQPTC